MSNSHLIIIFASRNDESMKKPTPQEIERFKQLEKLMNPQLPIPTDSDVEECIAKIEVRLSEKAINRKCNLAVKEGYTKAIYVLKNRIGKFSDELANGLTTTQGRAIAACAVDYLHGWCSEEALCGVPIKKM